MWNLFPRQSIGRAYLIFYIISEDLLNADLRIPLFQFVLTHCSVIDKGMVDNHIMLRGEQIKELNGDIHACWELGWICCLAAILSVTDKGFYRTAQRSRKQEGWFWSSFSVLVLQATKGNPTSAFAIVIAASASTAQALHWSLPGVNTAAISHFTILNLSCLCRAWRAHTGHGQRQEFNRCMCLYEAWETVP